MKQQVNPAVAAVVIIVIVCVAGFFIWKGASGGAGSKAAGEPGNAGPFAPGGAALGKQGSAAPPQSKPGGG